MEEILKLVNFEFGQQFEIFIEDNLIVVEEDYQQTEYGKNSDSCCDTARENGELIITKFPHLAIANYYCHRNKYAIVELKLAQMNSPEKIIDLSMRHLSLIENNNILISVYTNASGFLWSAMKVDSGTNLGGSEYDGDCEMSGAFTSYTKALEHAVDLISKGKDLAEFEKSIPNKTFHWSNYIDWIKTKLKNNEK